MISAENRRASGASNSKTKRRNIDMIRIPTMIFWLSIVSPTGLESSPYIGTGVVAAPII
jgi:hypothetical protein